MSALDADALLIDWEPCELAGEPAVRTLVLEQLGGLATVVLEQWRLVAAGHGVDGHRDRRPGGVGEPRGRPARVVATLEVEP